MCYNQFETKMKRGIKLKMKKNMKAQETLNLISKQ